MQDNNLVTDRLHWLTSTSTGWGCVHPSCDWYLDALNHDQHIAQLIFRQEHTKLVRARG